MDKEKKDLLVFGYGLSLILIVLGGRWGWKYGFGLGHVLQLLIAAVLAGMTWRNPFFLKGFYRQWMTVAKFVGLVLSTVTLTVLYYGVFGVVGCVLRLLRKDLLDQAFARGKSSYWITRPKTEFHKESYLRQF